MSRYDVYPNPSGPGYLLDVQADILRQMSTRAAVPLLPLNQAPKPAKTLNPVFDIAGEPHVMVTQYLASVPERELQTPTCSLQHQHDDIVAAVDFLFHGF
ncbi:MAG: CcdB family protein [Burkholderiaceae bacterium]